MELTEGHNRDQINTIRSAVRNRLLARDASRKHYSKSVFTKCVLGDVIPQTCRDFITEYQLLTNFRLCLTIKLINRCRFDKGKNHQNSLNVPLFSTNSPIVDKCWALAYDSVISSFMSLQSSFNFGFKGWPELWIPYACDIQLMLQSVGDQTQGKLEQNYSQLVFEEIV